MSNKGSRSSLKPNPVSRSQQMILMEKELDRFIQKAGMQNNVLYLSELNEQLPLEVTHPEVLDQLMIFLKKKLIHIQYPVSHSSSLVDLEEKEDSTELKMYRSNDPVRLYLRKMGKVSLLDRKGEVDIAKRIEKGERKIIRAILMCPMGTQEVIRLGDHLKRKRLKVKSIFRGLEDEERHYNEKEYIDKIFELIDHVKKYQVESKKHFYLMKDNPTCLLKVEKDLNKLSFDLMIRFKSINFNRKIINRIVNKFDNLLKRMEELQKRLKDAVKKNLLQRF